MHRVVARFGVGMALAVFLVALALASQPPSALAQPSRSAAAAATWTLIDNDQSICFVQGSPYPNYYGIWIKGTWKRQIRVGVSSLPAGATWSTSYSPIPPGSSDGIGSLAYVAVTLAPNTPLGSYTASLWAKDGTVTQRVPVDLVVKTKCSPY